MAENTPGTTTTTTQVKAVQLGDPGVGFDLHFPGKNSIPAGATITLTLKVEVGTTTHSSVLTIHGPVTEDHTTIVMPYGCDHYVPGSELQIEIMGQLDAAHASLLPVQQGHAPYFVYYRGPHVAQNGDFNFRVRRDFLAPLNEPLGDFIRGKNIYKRRGSVLLSGESLQSQNGRYRCRLEFDGRLHLYDLESENPMGAIWNSGSSIPFGLINPGKGQYFAVLSQDGVLYVYTNTDNPLKIWDSYTDATNGSDRENHPKGNFHLVMRDNGSLCTSSKYPVSASSDLKTRISKIK